MKSAFLAISVLALAGCSNKNVDSLEAVKQGIVSDLAKTQSNLTMGAMDVNVVSVSFRDKEADAVVSFSPKGGPPALTMKYTMERQGNDWHIKDRAKADLQKHAAQAPPTSAEGGGMMGGGQSQLPAGHPPMGDAGSMGSGSAGSGSMGSGKQLPAGHPPLDKQ